MRARCIAHYVVTVQSCPLSDHRREATCVREHFRLIRASYKIVGDQALLFLRRLLVALVAIATS